MTTISRFWRGLAFLPAGWLLLARESRLRKWALVPWLIDLALLIGGWFWGVGLISALVGKAVALVISPGLGIWHSLLYYPLVLILSLGFFALWLYAIFLVASIIAAPFNALLAEGSLEALGALPPRAKGVRNWLKFSLRMLRVSLVKAGIFALFGLVLLVCSFIPVVNLIAAFLALMIMAFDVMDYSFEACGQGLTRRLRYFRTHLPELAGMAASLALTLLIPGLTVLALPLAVVGASAIVAKGAHGSGSDS